MFNFGSKKTNDKFHGRSVFKKSRSKGYTQVHASWILQELEVMRRATTLRDASASKISPDRSSSCQMMDHLLHFMAFKKTQWIALKNDHWMLDQDLRCKMLKKKLL